MTIPISQPNINPPVLSGGETGGGMSLLLRALEHRQQLDLARKKFAQDQQEFELQKKLTGSTMAGNELENDKKKREFKEHQLELDAADEGLQLVTGNLMRLNDPTAFGQILAKIKDPRIAKYVMGFRDAHIKQEQDLAQTEANRNPTGRYREFSGPDGNVFVMDSKTGTIKPGNVNVGQRGNTNAGIRTEELDLAATNVIDALTDVEGFIKKNPDADIVPMFSAGLRGAKTTGQGSIGGAIAGFLEPLGTQMMSPAQLEVQRRREVFKHTFTSFLPKSRGQIAIIESVANMAFPKAGESDPGVRADAAKLRLEIKHKLQNIRARLRVGKSVSSDLLTLPVYTAAAAEAVNNPVDLGDTQATPNLGDYLTGVPK